MHAQRGKIGTLLIRSLLGEESKGKDCKKKLSFQKTADANRAIKGNRLSHQVENREPWHLLRHFPILVYEFVDYEWTGLSLTVDLYTQVTHTWWVELRSAIHQAFTRLMR